MKSSAFEKYYLDTHLLKIRRGLWRELFKRVWWRDFGRIQKSGGSDFPLGNG